MNSLGKVLITGMIKKIKGTDWWIFIRQTGRF